MHVTFKWIGRDTPWNRLINSDWLVWRLWAAVISYWKQKLVLGIWGPSLTSTKSPNLMGEKKPTEQLNVKCIQREVQAYLFLFLISKFLSTKQMKENPQKSQTKSKKICSSAIVFPEAKVQATQFPKMNLWNLKLKSRKRILGLTNFWSHVGFRSE